MTQPVNKPTIEIPNTPLNNSKENAEGFGAAIELLIHQYPWKGTDSGKVDLLGIMAAFTTHMQRAMMKCDKETRRKIYETINRTLYPLLDKAETSVHVNAKNRH